MLSRRLALAALALAASWSACIPAPISCDGSTAGRASATSPTPARRSTSARASPSLPRGQRRTTARRAGPPPIERRPAGGPCPPPDRCDLLRRRRPPDVTLADLASFRPARPTLDGRAAGFGVVGMPTNVVATASEQRIAGNAARLGRHGALRAGRLRLRLRRRQRPRATATGGASWQRLGQAQFTPTATSHVYRERGTYPGVGDRAVRGIRRFRLGNLAAGRRLRHRRRRGGYDVRVVEVRTALVDQTCVENPRGPGC